VTAPGLQRGQVREPAAGSRPWAPPGRPYLDPEHPPGARAAGTALASRAVT